MKTVIDVNQRRIVNVVNKIYDILEDSDSVYTRITIDDIKEEKGVFYAEMNINKISVEKLPPSLQRFVFTTEEKIELFSEIDSNDMNLHKLINNKIREKIYKIK